MGRLGGCGGGKASVGFGCCLNWVFWDLVLVVEHFGGGLPCWSVAEWFELGFRVGCLGIWSKLVLGRGVNVNGW